MPLQSLDKRVTHVLRRAQDVLIHSLVCATVRQAMPMLFGKDKAKAAEIEKLPATCQLLADKHHLSVKDFAAQDQYAQFFGKVDLFAMKSMEEATKLKWFETLKKVIEVDLPGLMKPIKASAVVDPRDRKHAIMVQRDYQLGLEAQLEGRRGVQGALGEMAAMPQRAIQNVGGPAAGAAGGGAGAMSPEQMMMMMQMMQAQQRPVAPVALPPPPPPQPAAPAQMTPEQMAMFMQMMKANGMQ